MATTQTTQATQATQGAYDYLCVLDFEATCWQDNNDHEIIEFPSVVIDVGKQTVVDSFRVFVKPAHNPCVSAFCHQLTGITQAQVDNGMTLQDALARHKQFAAPYLPRMMVVTCGDWDLREMLPRDVRASKGALRVPKYLTRWINIKVAFRQHLNDPHFRGGMPRMLEHLGLPLVGRHHSGIDDCRNIAAIALAMLRGGWIPGPVHQLSPKQVAQVG